MKDVMMSEAKHFCPNTEILRSHTRPGGRHQGQTLPQDDISWKRIGFIE